MRIQCHYYLNRDDIAFVVEKKAYMPLYIYLQWAVSRGEIMIFNINEKKCQVDKK